MDRERGDTDVFELLCQFDTDEGLGVPAGAHLDRDRLLYGFHDRFGDGHREVRIAQQGRAGVIAGDLRRGAAHVEVDRLTGELRFDPLRGLRQNGGVVPEELDGARVFEVREL